jgi:predicted component of type VI protein secretion system
MSNEEHEEMNLRLKFERGDYIDPKEIKQNATQLRKFAKVREFKVA